MTNDHMEDLFSFRQRHNYPEQPELTDGEVELFNKLIDFEPNMTDDGTSTTLLKVAPHVDGIANGHEKVERSADRDIDVKSSSLQPTPAPMQPVQALPQLQNCSRLLEQQHQQHQEQQQQEKNYADGTTDRATQKKRPENYKHILFLEPNTALFHDKSSELDRQQQRQLYDLNRKIVLDHFVHENELLLDVVEQPRQCRVSSYGERDRRPIDPAPIVKLDILSKAGSQRRHSCGNLNGCVPERKQSSSSSLVDGIHHRYGNCNEDDGNSVSTGTACYNGSNNDTSDEEDYSIEEDDSVDWPFYVLHASLWSVDKQMKYDLIEDGGTNAAGGEDTSSNVEHQSIPATSSSTASLFPSHQAHQQQFNSNLTDKSSTESADSSIPAASAASSLPKSTSSTSASTVSSPSSNTLSSGTAACEDTGTLRILMGSVISSPSFLNDYNPDQSVVNKRAYFFAFPDLSVRITGQFRLQFSLIDLARNKVVKDIFSEPFTVYSAKGYPGMKESSSLSKYLAKQGLKLTVRKHVRSKKNNNAGGSKDTLPN